MEEGKGEGTCLKNGERKGEEKGKRKGKEKEERSLLDEE